jgi:hypothetical protein
MGFELELAVLLAISVAGQSTFAAFEAETPAWRKILKWSMVTALSWAVYRSAGHIALAIPLGLGLVGLAVHFWWCARHDIHPVDALPRRRYYELRGWVWRE